MTANDAAFRDRYGPWAVVAGASEGIGAEFARQLASRGLDLVLAARRAGPLEAFAAELRSRHGVEVETHAVDLADADSVRGFGREAGTRQVGFLVYNAALSLIGRYFDHPIENRLRELDTNCRAPLLLIDALVPPMLERGRGGVILMTSLSGIQGTPYIGNYAATKAWNLIFGESLWGELGPRGVDVLSVLAGATRTPGYLANTAGRSTAAPVGDTDEVVNAALAALGKRPSVIAGGANKAAAFLMTRLLPRPQAVRIMAKATYKLLAR
ncbi:MAG: SDR family NAD(P)-dependent oxidoreductase [Deltaproteobacteria bacterium]|nr:SDR family NAD(P)-dependent oxidoreductase [Deltaproteobacteria bacterium]